MKQTALNRMGRASFDGWTMMTEKKEDCKISEQELTLKHLRKRKTPYFKKKNRSKQR